MDGLSAVANSFAVVSVAIQLSEVCVKLYMFWESIEDAPQEVAAIKEDLQYLISVFKRIESTEARNSRCIREGVQHCRIKVADLASIVKSFDDGFRAVSRRKRLHTAFRAALHSKHIQRFRDSLNDTKATLTLAMVHECVIQASSRDLEAVRLSHILSNSLATYKIRLPASSSIPAQPPAPLHPYTSSSSPAGRYFPQQVKMGPLDVAGTTLTHFERAVHDPAQADSSVRELMLHAISQTAIATFESTSLDIFAQDAYMLDEHGQLLSKTFVYSQKLKYQLHYQASSFRTPLGTLWIRKTTISHAATSTECSRQSQTVTSVVFYPKRWLQLLGITKGLEAIAASTRKSWMYNCRINATRAIPEDSPIFTLCLAGETRSVQLLLEKGQGSVVDTIPKGWKPLHYAAIAGHVDLCSMLLKAGADKSALVYEGPTESVLSPISLFVSHSTDRCADEKIDMLRLFCDCIDLSDADSEGWLVHEWLKKAYARERKPISQNSITWLLHLSANEDYVEFSARNVWTAQQHAIRSVLNHARFSKILERILDLSMEEQKSISQHHVDALGVWLALRATGRVLLPMVVNAGSFLGMRGFDWVEHGMTHIQFLQAFPNIYKSWCHAVLDSVEQLEVYMREEFEHFLGQLGKTRKNFLTAISRTTTTFASSNGGGNGGIRCTDCGDDYTALHTGLVSPSYIALTECVKTGHDFICACEAIERDPSHNTHQPLPAYNGSCHTGDVDESDVVVEEFFDAEPYLFCNGHASESDMCSSIATILYRAHGRVWLGNYAI